MTADDVGVTTWFLPERGVAGLRWAQQLGFVAVHVDARDLAELGSTEFAAAARDLGVDPIGVAAVEIEEIGLESREPARRAISDAIELAKDLDADLVYLPAFGSAAIASTADLVRFAGLLRYAIDSAEDHVKVAVEAPMAADDLAKLFHEVDDSRLRLLLDTQNPTLWGHPVGPIVDAFAQVIGAVHVKDGSGTMGNRQLGHGDADLVHTLSRLAVNGYTGRFVIENDYRSASTIAAFLDRSALNDLWGTARRCRQPAGGDVTR